MAAEALRAVPDSLPDSLPDPSVPGPAGDESPVERLARLAARAAPVSLAREHVLPVHPALEPLLVAGLQRGTTVSVSGPGATTLALAVAAGPVSRGSWAAVVGFPSLGLVAAQRAGVALDHLAVISDPPSDQRAGVLAALVGAFDVVVVPSSLHLAAGPARRLAARLRERGSVLVRVARSRARGDAAAGADLLLRATAVSWQGMGEGYGHLQGRRVRVEVDGRRAGGRARHADLWLPGPDGAVHPAEAPVQAITDRVRSDSPSGPVWHVARRGAVGGVPDREPSADGVRSESPSGPVWHVARRGAVGGVPDREPSDRRPAGRGVRAASPAVASRGGRAS